MDCVNLGCKSWMSNSRGCKLGVQISDGCKSIMAVHLGCTALMVTNLVCTASMGVKESSEYILGANIVMRVIFVIFFFK